MLFRSSEGRALVTRPGLDTDREARERTVQRIIAIGVVAVLRLRDERGAANAIAAVHAGGVSAIEITMTTPNALRVIESVARERGDDVVLGVGSVLDAATAASAIAAGARYVVSPVVKPEVMEEAHRLGVAAMLGAFSPTEILEAHESGSDLVKVSPAEVLGPAFIKGVLAPMPFLRLMPTGGITPENAGDWILAGAQCVGVGSALIDPKLVIAGDFAAITDRARRLIRSVAAARPSQGAPR